MTSTISRRTLVRGGAWAAPAVLASATIPAYAASIEYYVVSSNTVTYAANSYEMVPYVDIDTTIPTGYPAGVTVTYDRGEARDTVATMNSLYYILALPKGLVTSYTLTFGNSTWRYAGIDTGIDYLNLNSGSRADVSNMDVHVFEFTGTTRNNVYESSYMQTWPGTTFKAESNAPSRSSIATYIPTYSGYFANYSTDTGWSAERSHIRAERLQVS